LQDARWALEAQMRRATGERKLEATLRLAELLGTGFLQHEDAAELLRGAVLEAPDSLPARRLLERTYLALRDLPRLLGAICDRAARAGSSSARGEAFAFASEIAETEGLDVKLARDFMELAACPEAPSFLARAASLAERAEARDVAIAYRKRLVAVLDDPHERARQHVAMAGLCDDPRERRVHFERAAAEVPGHATAWEGLEKVASELGERVANVGALRTAIDATLAPRRKAQLLLLLGAQLAKTDREAAFRACDEAFRTDPSNERAAAVMLDRLSDEKRHSEALVACELLLAAATRDEKLSDASVLVRKLARLALVAGDPGKALSVCLSAIGTLPKDAHPLGELAFALVKCGTSVDLATRTARAADLLVARRIDLEPRAVCALGTFLAARSDHERAILVLLPVLDSNASHTLSGGSSELTRHALELLSPAYEATGDLRSAVTTRLLLSRLSDDARRHLLLVSAIDLLVRRLGDLDGAVPVLDEALAHRPDDLPLLHTAMRVFGELHAWTRLAPIVGRIAALQDVPERRAKYLAAQAQIVCEKLEDPTRAAALYDAVLDADKTRLDAFSTLTRLYDALGDHQALERFKKLSRVYANRLGDVASAEKALEAARRLDPNDRSVRALAVDVLVGGDELERAVAVLRSDIRRDPHDARSYERLHEMFLRQGRLDHAVTTAQILSGFRASTARELRLLGNAAPKALHDVPGCLSDHAWASHLTHPDLCPSLTALLTTLARAHTRLFARTKGMPSFPGAEDEDPTGIRHAIVDACEILSLPVATPLFGRWGGKEALSRRAQTNGALLVDVEAVRWAQPILPYLLGKKLAEGRPELASRGAFSGDRALRAVVTSGLRIGMGHVESSQETTLHRALTESERAALVTAAREIQSLGSKLDVRKWSRAVDLSSARAGLLLSQDVRVARKAIGSEPQGPHDLAPRERIGELCVFATSELYADLRKAIGLAVPTSRAVPRASLQSFSLLSA
jgi:tetratricopeptide (TPR) repeat protein